ncbi:MAG TPA: serine hydrolase [Candidatus Kryptonia bacterium]|nr:serine hydrolase [Candidatus Kryptonia bacterium]
MPPKAWVLVALIAVGPVPSHAGQINKPFPKKVPEPRALLLADATSGRVLRERGADEPIALGSLGQLMIALLVLERVDAHQLTLEQPLPPSAAAASIAGARLLGEADDQTPLEDWLRASIVAGAPDATVTVASALAATPADVIALMNDRARSLGMIGTEYGSLLGTARSAKQPIDVTTARDTARLVTELVRHRPVLEWAALGGFPFRDGAALLRNPNQLLGTVPGVNGLLVTGDSHVGFHVVATARRGALQLLAITLGAADNATRYSNTAEWLEWGFATFERIEIVRAGEPLLMPVRLRAGVEGQLIPVAAAGCSLLRRHDEEHHFEIGFQVPDALTAPIARDQRIGEIIVREDGQVLAVVPAVSPADFAAADGVVSAATNP